MMPTDTRVELTWEQARRARIAASGLIAPFATAEEAAARLFGIQAQIEPAAGLALWNRTPSFTEEAFGAALFAQRTLVKLWGQRGTLHAYASTDWPLLHGARSINVTWWERQAADPANPLEDYRHHVDAVAALLRSRPTMGRSDLRASDLELHEDLYSGWGGIFADLVRLGHACHAGRAGGEGRFAAREQWLPHLEWNPPDADTANIEVARRFFAAYGPATLGDFAYWRGCTQAQARAWLAALGTELATLSVAGIPMLARTDALDALAALPQGAAANEGIPLRMLFRFDPLLLGHRDKEWVAPAAVYKRIWRPAGHIEGLVLHRGRAVATWRYARKASGLLVSVARFRPLPATVTGKLPRVAADVARYFGLPLADLTYVDNLD
jgi:hypothetical protein